MGIIIIAITIMVGIAVADMGRVIATDMIDREGAGKQKKGWRSMIPNPFLLPWKQRLEVYADLGEDVTPDDVFAVDRVRRIGGGVINEGRLLIEDVVDAGFEVPVMQAVIHRHVMGEDARRFILSGRGRGQIVGAVVPNHSARIAHHIGEAQVAVRPSRRGIVGDAWNTVRAADG